MIITPPFLALNLALRGAAVALLLLAAATLLRRERHTAGRLGALLALGTAAFAVNSSPGFRLDPAIWHTPIAALTNGNAMIFWLFTAALFTDDFRLRRWHGAAWGLLSIAGAANCMLLFPARLPFALTLQFALQCISFALALAAVVGTLRGWHGDLVETRRVRRLVLVGIAAGYATLLATVDLLQPPQAAPANESVVNAFALAGLGLLAVWSLLQHRREGLFADANLAQNSADITDIQGDADAIDIPLPDPALLAAIERQMREERLYRHEGFNLAMLAKHLGLPEHRLRKTINQQLGYRNFSAFANHYRLDEVKTALLDPGQADVPILTIALDAGYGSLGPFNRAFKAATGLTPSEFRRASSAEAKVFTQQRSPARPATP